jgi:hypothetical protein
MTNSDILTLNEYYFHTMHHEFSHILHQTKTYPVSYGQVTPSTYDPLKWQERDSVETHTLGYVTNYGSSAEKEDFVENLSCIITDTDYRWMTRIIDACMEGVRNGDKEEILTFIDSLEVQDFDNPEKPWNNFYIYLERDTVENTQRYVPCTKLLLRYESYYDSSKKYDFVTHITNFKTDFLNNWVKISTADDLAGMNALLKKINISTTWYTEKWGLYAYTVRREVRKRQDSINEYLRDNLVLFDYKTSNSESK